MKWNSPDQKVHPFILDPNKNSNTWVVRLVPLPLLLLLTVPIVVPEGLLLMLRIVEVFLIVEFSHLAFQCGYICMCLCLSCRALKSNKVLDMVIFLVVMKSSVCDDQW